MDYKLEDMKITKNVNLPVHIFTPESGDSKAVVQFLYGVNHNIFMYNKLINLLTENGYTVVCGDLIEHGKNGFKVPYFKNTFDETAEQQLKLNNNIKQSTFLPVIVLAQSYGAFLALKMMHSVYFNTDGVLLAGVGDISTIKNKMVSGVLKTSNRLNKANYMRSDIRNAKNLFIYRDKPLTNQKTIHDTPLKLAADFAARVSDKQLYDCEHMKINLEKAPVLLMSGGLDKLTNKGKSTLKLYAEMKSANVACDCKILKNTGASVLKEMETDTKNVVALNDVANFVNNVYGKCHATASKFNRLK